MTESSPPSSLEPVNPKAIAIHLTEAAICNLQQLESTFRRAPATIYLSAPSTGDEAKAGSHALLPAYDNCGSYLWSGNMYLDHPVITATHSLTEPDRLERLNRVYGYMVGEADDDHNPYFIRKLAQLHDDRGTMTVFWHEPLTEKEKQYCLNAWQSLIGDRSSNVEFSMNPPKPTLQSAS